MLKTYDIEEKTAKQFIIYCATNQIRQGKTITNLLNREMSKNPQGSIPNLLEDSPMVIENYCRNLDDAALKKLEWMGRIIEVYAGAYLKIDKA